MKRIVIFVCLILLICTATAQSLCQHIHSEKIDMQLSMVAKRLASERIADSNMIVLPIFGVKPVTHTLCLDTLMQSYIKTLQFIKYNDDLSGKPLFDGFYLYEVLVYYPTSNDVYRVNVDLRFPSPVFNMDDNRPISLSTIYASKIYQYIAKLHYNNCIDCVFVYPTSWTAIEKVIVDGVFFAIKNDEVYVVTDSYTSPGLFLLDDFVDAHWNELTGKRP